MDCVHMSRIRFLVIFFIPTQWCDWCVCGIISSFKNDEYSSIFLNTREIWKLYTCALHHWARIRLLGTWGVKINWTEVPDHEVWSNKNLHLEWEGRKNDRIRTNTGIITSCALILSYADCKQKHKHTNAYNFVAAKNTENLFILEHCVCVSEFVNVQNNWAWTNETCTNGFSLQFFRPLVQSLFFGDLLLFLQRFFVPLCACWSFWKFDFRHCLFFQLENK